MRPFHKGFAALGIQVLFALAPLSGQEVASGTLLQIRLNQPISSAHSKQNDVVDSVLLSPITVGDSILVPAGTRVVGTVTYVKKVGLGLLREKSSMQLDFTTLILPDGSAKAIKSRVAEIDDAREVVSSTGRIQGVRATASYGSKATGFVTGLASFDPLLALFAFSGSTLVLRFPEPEIWYPAGTEINLKLQEPIVIEHPVGTPVREITASAEEKFSLENYVADLPFRTLTRKTEVPSDITNLLFLGSEEQIDRGFTAAGWTTSDPLGSTTKYNTAMALAQDRAYRQGPMSVLLLDGHAPYTTYQKNLNSFAKRHHLRIWQLSEPWMGVTTWTASATHDIGIGRSSQSKAPTHLIDPNIDDERSKIINDLVFTNCVDAVQLVERARVPRIARNGSGEPLFTDGRIAVIQLNACDHPRDVTGTREDDSTAKSGPALGRGIRQVNLTIRNSLLRDNMGWQAYSGGRYLIRVMHHAPHQLPAEVPTQAQIRTQTEAQPSATNRMIGIAPELPGPDKSEAQRRGLAGVEFGFDGGLSRPRELGDVFLATYDPVQDVTDVLQFPLKIEAGAELSSRVAIHTQRRFSHEISYSFLQANLRIGGTDVTEKDRLRIREVGYSLQMRLGPRKWRLAPYVSVGPSLTSFSLKNTTVHQSDAVFRFVLRSAGPIVKAFNSAGDAPLDGGTVFRVGLDYRAGCKIRITSLISVRLEYGENLSADPDFFNRQSAYFGDQGIATAQDQRSSRHSAMTIGLVFHP